MIDYFKIHAKFACILLNKFLKKLYYIKDINFIFADKQ